MRTTLPDLQRVSRDPLFGKADRCAGALTEARRLVAVQAYGPLLSQLLARACELLDEIDEILVGLHPGRDHDAFACAAGLHRNLEEIQSLAPRDCRLPRREN